VQRSARFVVAAADVVLHGLAEALEQGERLIVRTEPLMRHDEHREIGRNRALAGGRIEAVWPSERVDRLAVLADGVLGHRERGVKIARVRGADTRFQRGGGPARRPRSSMH
jgi:hypothetical protein